MIRKQWLFFLLGLCAVTVSAQLYQHGAPPPDLLCSGNLLRKVANALRASQQIADQRGAKDSAGVSVDRSGASTAAKKLAAAYPAKARAEAERVFGMLLMMYPQVEQKLGMPANELGGAVALLLVTSLQAYHQRDVQLEQFKTVAAQIRGLVSARPAIARTPESEKLEAYEQLAIIGMFLDGVHEALQPNAQVAANMTQAARGWSSF